MASNYKLTDSKWVFFNIEGNLNLNMNRKKHWYRMLTLTFFLTKQQTLWLRIAT